MTTECNRDSLVFQSLGRREVVGRFDGGKTTSDADLAMARIRLRQAWTDLRAAAALQQIATDGVTSEISPYGH